MTSSKTSWLQGNTWGDYWELTHGYDGWHIWFGGTAYTIQASASTKLPKTLMVICNG